MAGGGSAEVYLEPGQPGVNELHLIFDVPGSDGSGVVSAHVTASDGDAPELLRQYRVVPGHYVDFVELGSGDGSST